MNNRGFIQHYISENPITVLLKFASIDHWPIISPWNHENLLNLCCDYTETRYAYVNIPNPSLKKAMIIGETLAPMIPHAPTQSARICVTDWMRQELINNIFDVLGKFNNKMY